ncbi:hypothetical protein PT274_03455 [Leuconostocaceae bacterium ESL0958]|nr:hypothetical protein [Leuconostocaceae bacterium ESL0958]
MAVKKNQDDYVAFAQEIYLPLQAEVDSLMADFYDNKRLVFDKNLLTPPTEGITSMPDAPSDNVEDAFQQKMQGSNGHTETDTRQSDVQANMSAIDEQQELAALKQRIAQQDQFIEAQAKELDLQKEALATQQQAVDQEEKEQVDIAPKDRATDNASNHSKTDIVPEERLTPGKSLIQHLKQELARLDQQLAADQVTQIKAEVDGDYSEKLESALVVALDEIHQENERAMDAEKQRHQDAIQKLTARHEQAVEEKRLEILESLTKENEQVLQQRLAQADQGKERAAQAKERIEKRLAAAEKIMGV